MRGRKKEKVKSKDWRCLVCNRFLGSEIKNGFLEIESKNRQLIITQPVIKKALCKCGVETTVSGIMTTMAFRS